MVNFVLGKAGSGKSTKLNEIILGKVKSGDEKIIVIVPEQMSFEKEKSMLEFLGNKDFKKIRVLSFSRLADFVANALKIPAFESSSDISQVIAVNQAIEKSKSELKIYLKSCTDMRLAELVLNTIRELKSNRINKEVLSEIYALCRKDILKQKISDKETES